MPAPSVRVIVRLPYNRPHSPEAPILDPPRVEWTQEKADILWKVIERARASENAGTDWKGLASHLEVQLPYLLYRANARFQEDIQGLKEIQGALSPALPRAPAPEAVDDTDKGARTTNRLGGSRLLSSVRLTTPLGVRTRINSVGQNARPRNPVSASTATLQGLKRYLPMKPATPSSSDDEGTDSEEEITRKEEEAERKAEESELLDAKLKELQRVMTSDTLGLVSAPPRSKGNRGRTGVASSSSLSSGSRNDALSSGSASRSVSSVNSPQGSIPEIPSTPPDSQSLSPAAPRSSGPSSPRRALSPRYGHLVERSPSEYDSIQGSETSSLSDFSDSSLLTSGLDSPSVSGVRGTTSRMSQYSRSRAAGRTSGFPL